MRRPILAAALSVAALVATAIHPGQAQQGQVPLPPGGFKPPPAPPIKPYQPVAVKPPPTLDDPSFVAFRKQLAETAGRKDRAALAQLVVGQNFFWMQEPGKDIADKHKPGIDSLAKATDLDAKDDSGWQLIASIASEASAAEQPQHKGIFCGPADPIIDPAAFEALGKATQTVPPDWGYPTKDGVEIHADAKPDSPVVEKLGMTLIHVLPDTAGPANPNDPFFLHVATPSGKSGYLDAQLLLPLGGDQMCYTKDASGWKIAGYLGGGTP